MSRVPWFLSLRIDNHDRHGPRYETSEAAISGAWDYFEQVPGIAIHLCHEDGRTPQRITAAGVGRHVHAVHAIVQPPPRPSSKPEVCPIHDVPLPADRTCEACIAVEPLAAKGYLR